MTLEKRRKVLAALTRKGFSYAAIRTVLSEYRVADGAGAGEEYYPEEAGI